jgi:hypothetical protein
MQDFSFEHDRGFAQGELSEALNLGKYQAHYEELFAEIIEDGVITAEERARLNRAADSLGLDRASLRRLEEALQAAYEARHHIRVQEMEGGDEQEAPASLVVSAQTAKDPRVVKLERRVAQLEARVAELTSELEQARAHVAVEVDVSQMPVGLGAASQEAPQELMRRMRNDPRDTETLRGLYRAYGASGDADKQWLAAQALAYLGAAGPAERETYERGRAQGLIKPASSVTPNGWHLIFHPDEELLTGQIFGVIVTAVLLGRVSTLRRDKALPKLDPAQKQDPATSTLAAVRCFSWAGAVLGIAAPALYADPEGSSLVEMVPGLPPVTRIGSPALSGRSPFELAFIAGRHLSWYRAEHFIRLLVPSIADLENLFLAALSIANADIPMGADVKRRVAPLARAIEPVLDPVAIDRLRGHFLRFIEEGGRTNLQRWASAAERTSARAGMLLANDLGAAQAVFEIEDPETAHEKMDDLIVYTTSDRYANLRRQMGLSLSV